ncbi:AraC family transcriptional regulator [Candidatus Skiveiella danica]|uniref:AraC family transcriptional regulator n=1 Tax=Candidatus Skiveiella danica TaxID=3386177 RepID=UPI0039B8A77E
MSIKASADLLPPDSGMIRVGPLLVIPGLLREFGLDPVTVFEGVGLPLATLADPEETIPFRLMCHLLAACVGATACPHFGLLVGQHNGIGSMGLIGFLAMQAPDAGTALREMIHHADLHDRGSTVRLSVAEGTATLRFDIIKPSATGAAEVTDGALALLRNTLLALCGRECKLLRVDLRHPRPEDVRPYQQTFQAPLSFGAEQNALVFNAKWLDSPVQQADPLMRRYLQDRVNESIRRVHLDFQDKVFQSVLDQVREGSSSLDALANRLAMHRRTLNRRLELCGTSFRALKSQARREIACEQLRDTGNSIESVATELGYTSASAFTRAFAKWEGLPPAAWRRKAAVPAKA